MRDVSLFRLYLLRGAYLIIAVGLGVMIWPGVIDPPADLDHMRGVVRALLAAVGLLAVLGIRHPLQMLPLLLFELAWKTIWMLAFGIPARLDGRLTGGMAGTWGDNVFGIVLLLVVIPWGHVWRRYVRQPGERWRRDDEPIAAGTTTAPA